MTYACFGVSTHGSLDAAPTPPTNKQAALMAQIRQFNALRPRETSPFFMMGS
jgi:hypothetical protein